MLLKPKSPVVSILFPLFFVLLLTARVTAQVSIGNKALHQLFDDYYEESLKLFPTDATQQGDTRYNDLLPNEGSISFLKEKHNFYTRYQQALKKFDYKKLNSPDKISYDILMDRTQRELGEEKFHPEYMPVRQVFSLPLTMAQFGAGTGAQPFKTVKDYDNWLKRMAAFAIWTDTAITNFKKGVKAGYVLPKAIVIKLIPQMESLATTDTAKSIFFGPIRNFPKDFSAADKARLATAYYTSINQQLLPSYQKLKDFFSNEYLPVARTTSGINALPNGDEMYRFYIYYYTTTHKTPEEVYQTGLNEVARITAVMEKIKDSLGFNGSLKDLFEFMKTNKQFMPFKTDEEVLNAYRAILNKVQPHLKDLFGVAPKTPFEIREVEAYRAASAPPQYNRGSPDGTRPGIFYVPIVDPTKVNVTGWAMEDVFLHEAIPGHHYQVSLQQENENLPKFRRFTYIGAFSEGWGLYAESLGEQLGCYTDPYQKLAALGGEIHRAIRLVVDVALHTGKMTREEAIKYMLDHEALPEQAVTLEIERYMAYPGTALSYKTGELKIKELRDKYQRQLGAKFSLRNFHDALLEGGSMPLDVFEKYMDEWARTQ
ncbi:MAG: DUF885 domain-containing protein [Chitinophagaceae bacterium]|nr:DUF885 domain-containing protein [Chitinophagaceae bacterium]